MSKSKIARFFSRLNRKWTKLNKKNKVIVYVIASVLLLAVIGGAIATAIILTKDSPLPNPVTFTVSHYTYAIRSGDNIGIKLTNEWMQGREKSNFEVLIKDASDTIKLDDYMVVSSSDKKGIDIECQIIFSYKKQTVATYDIIVIANAIYIQDVSDIKKIASNAQNKIYIQRNNITISDSLSIDEFYSGVYYGNYFRLSYLDISQQGGLFNKAQNSLFYTINLSNVHGNIVGKPQSNYGALINTATDCYITDCKVSGEFAITAEKGSNIGGLVGKMTGIERLSDSQVRRPYEILLSNASVDITANGKSEFCIGGVAGKVIDITITKTSHNGKITIDTISGENITVGGVAGYFEKQYNRVAPKINFFDNGTRLSHSGDIIINTQDSLWQNTITVGGIYGVLKNHNLMFSQVSGDILLNSNGASFIVGGAVGMAENQLSHTTVRMEINSCPVQSNMTINTTGNLFAGGIIGLSKDVYVVDTTQFGILVIDKTADDREISIGNIIGKTAPNAE